MLTVTLAVAMLGTGVAMQPASGQTEALAVDEVEQLKEHFRGGGTLGVLLANGDPVDIPVAVSSVLPARPGITEDETVVLRGALGTTVANVILYPDRVGIVVSIPGQGTSKTFIGPELPDGTTARSSVFVPADLPSIIAEDILPGTPTHEHGTGDAHAAEDLGVPESSANFLHVLPEGGGSIVFSKHIHEGVEGSPIDPVNAVFYGWALSGNVRNEMTKAGWGNTWCGGDKYMHVLDARHGGIDTWHRQLDHWAVQGCIDDRMHLRLFALGSGGWYDNHEPGFDSYSFGPVHWEADFDHDPVDPTLGQDYLLSELLPSSTIGNIWQSKVPNSAGDCANCGRWNGWITFYQLGGEGETGANDPCGKFPAPVVTLNGRPYVNAYCFDATFSQVRGNEYWVQANVGSNGPTVLAVDVKINGGNWLPLTKQTWGATAWAASYRVVQGSTVQLRAYTTNGNPNVNGITDDSACYRWIPAANVDAAVVSCSYAFDATFTNPNGNEWWVAVTVTANKALAGVDAQVNCGTPIALVKQSWGEWAKSFNVPAGSKVSFIARATTGETDRSGGYIWPTATPTTGC